MTLSQDECSSRMGWHLKVVYQVEQTGCSSWTDRSISRWKNHIKHSTITLLSTILTIAEAQQEIRSFLHSLRLARPRTLALERLLFAS